MSTHRHSVETLRKLGMTETSARVYLALLAMGEGSASDISRISRVPTSKIYRVLDHMNQSGLVIAHPVTPKRFEPVPIGTFLDATRRHHAEAVARLDSEREALEAAFAIQAAPAPKPRASFLEAHGRAHAEECLLNVLQDARTDAILILASDYLANHARHFERAWTKAGMRGVRLRILLEDHVRQSQGFTALIKEAEVRTRTALHSPATGAALLVIDGTIAVLVTCPADNENPWKGHDVAIVIQSGSIARHLLELAESGWHAADTSRSVSVTPSTPPTQPPSRTLPRRNDHDRPESGNRAGNGKGAG